MDRSWSARRATSAARTTGCDWARLPCQRTNGVDQYPPYGTKVFSNFTDVVLPAERSPVRDAIRREMPPMTDDEFLRAFFSLALPNSAFHHRDRIDDFERFLRAYPLLLDARLPLRHWSHARLFTRAARGTWQEPDLVPLPF